MQSKIGGKIKEKNDDNIYIYIYQNQREEVK